MKCKLASATMLMVHVAPVRTALHCSLPVTIPHRLEVTPIESAHLQTPWGASTAQNDVSHVVLLLNLRCHAKCLSCGAACNERHLPAEGQSNAALY